MLSFLESMFSGGSGANDTALLNEEFNGVDRSAAQPPKKQKVLITGGGGNLAHIILQGLHQKYDMYSVQRTPNTKPSSCLYKEIFYFDLLDANDIAILMQTRSFDILIHTAIVGGRRTKPEDGETLYTNLLMFENLMLFSNKFKMILNFDSGAVYDRATNIYMRNEDDIWTVPRDYYGFSKYIINERARQFSNVYQLRIFNIFHKDEEPDRFVRGCITSKQNGQPFTIMQDKYFDFFSATDFVAVVDFYLRNFDSVGRLVQGDDIYEKFLPKAMNLCYLEKTKLSDIARYIMGDDYDRLVTIENPIKCQIAPTSQSDLSKFSYDSCAASEKCYKEEFTFNPVECTAHYCGNGELLDTFVDDGHIVLEGLYTGSGGLPPPATSCTKNWTAKPPL